MTNHTVTVPAMQLVMPDIAGLGLDAVQPAITLNATDGRVGHVLAVGDRWYAYAVHVLDGTRQHERLIGARSYPTPQDALNALIGDYVHHLEPRR